MLPLGDKPMIAYSMETATAVKSLDAVVLSTDMEDAIAYAATHFPQIEVPFKRPDSLAGDESSLYDVVIDLYRYYEEKGNAPTHLVLLQPTSPFRKVEEMESGIDMLRNGAESVLGVSPVMHHPAEYLYEENGKIQFLMSEWNAKRRQEFPEIWFNNGAFYGCSFEFLQRTGKFFDENSALLKMSEGSLLDINTEFEYLMANGIAIQKNMNH